MCFSCVGMTGEGIGCRGPKVRVWTNVFKALGLGSGDGVSGRG